MEFDLRKEADRTASFPSAFLTPSSSTSTTSSHSQNDLSSSSTSPRSENTTTETTSLPLDQNINEAMDETTLQQQQQQPPPSPPHQPSEPIHNLIHATQLLQSGKSFHHGFTPAPILRVNSIRIQRSNALRPNFLAGLCRPYLDPSLSLQNHFAMHSIHSFLYGSRITHPLPGQPTTLSSILALTSSLATDLDKLDVFNGIEASLAPSNFPGATEEDVDILLSCGKPRGRIFLKSTTDVGNGEGSASIQGMLRNMFGGAETLQGSATVGTRTRKAFHLDFGMPLLAGNVDHQFKISAFALDRDLTSFSSLYENVKGVKVSLSTITDHQEEEQEQEENQNSTHEMTKQANNNQHELTYEASIRTLDRLLPDVSMSIRKLIGGSNQNPSIKSCISYTFLRDTRNDPVQPTTQGNYFKWVSEYAGLGGDTHHLKTELETCTSHQWFDSFFSTISFRTGILHPLSSSSGGLSYSDRFQLGGPTSIRMFQLNGLGPKHDLDSLGGTSYWSLGLSSFYRTRSDWPVFFHSFLNIGHLSQSNLKVGPTSTFLHDFLFHPSVSTGLGLVYLQGPLRVELNLGVPLVASRSDSLRKGLQLGVGVSFL